MKLLITGGSGLVGSAFDDGIKLSSKDVNLMEFKDILKFIYKTEPTHIIHAAARVGGLLGNMNHKGEFFYENIIMNTNTLEAARIMGVKRVLSFLSTCIFPDHVRYPLTEDQIHNGEPHNSNYPYAYAKRMLDIQSRAYNEQYGCNFICVAPTNIYGPNDNFHLQNGHVIPMLIHKCYLAKRNKTDFVIWGSGAPLREFIYSKDIAKISMWLLENYNEQEPIILTTSEETSIGDVAELIAKYMEFDGNIVYDRTKPDGQFRKWSSNEKLKKYLPDFEYTPLEVGIKETVKWFNEKYPNVRK
jgi:GDP-L-fucose synthase